MWCGSLSGDVVLMMMFVMDVKDEVYMWCVLEVVVMVMMVEMFLNLCVGCVVVDAREDVVVGEGYYLKVGELYVEVFVLCVVGEFVRGVMVYVMFELCNYYGWMSSCARAFVDAGVARVVVGFIDLDLCVFGGGI